MKPIISIIIPTHNELRMDYLRKSLENLSGLEGVELIIVDKKSDDGTSELALKHADKFISSRENSRAGRLNQGIEMSSGEIIFLHHPRSLIDPGVMEYLKKNKENFMWGGLLHQFDSNHPLLEFTSWYSNNVRGRIREILYLDHCIFFKKTLINRQPFIPAVDIFEDTLLSLKLRKLAPLHLLPFVSKTSAVRFNQNGTWRQAMFNQLLKIGFILKLSDKWMNRLYEAGLSLNSTYKKASKV